MVAPDAASLWNQRAYRGVLRSPLVPRVLQRHASHDFFNGERGGTGRRALTDELPFGGEFSGEPTGWSCSSATGSPEEAQPPHPTPPHPQPVGWRHALRKPSLCCVRTLSTRSSRSHSSIAAAFSPPPSASFRWTASDFINTTSCGVVRRPCHAHAPSATRHLDAQLRLRLRNIGTRRRSNPAHAGASGRRLSTDQSDFSARVQLSRPQISHRRTRRHSPRSVPPSLIIRSVPSGRLLHILFHAGHAQSAIITEGLNVTELAACLFV